MGIIHTLNHESFAIGINQLMLAGCETLGINAYCRHHKQQYQTQSPEGYIPFIHYEGILCEIGDSPLFHILSYLEVIK